MPMYEYKCKKCSIEITVLRNFNDYQIEPKEVELEEEKKPKACGEVSHDWERLIGGSIRAVRGPGWRGGKGFWSIIGYLCIQLLN